MNNNIDQHATIVTMPRNMDRSGVSKKKTQKILKKQRTKTGYIDSTADKDPCLLERCAALDWYRFSDASEELPPPPSRKLADCYTLKKEAVNPFETSRSDSTFPKTWFLKC
jgi:hypothetical protein